MRVTHTPSTDPADYGFRHQLRVRFAETDAMGVVHHGSYLPYLEEARVAWLRHMGRPYAQLRAETGIDISVIEVHVRYRQPLRFDDLVDVHVAVAATTRTTLQLAYLLRIDGETASTAVTVHGCVDQHGRAQRLPEWLQLV